MWFEGPLEPALLARILTEIVRRHEIFWTRFPAVDGGPAMAIEKPWTVELPVTDLRHLGLEGRVRPRRRAARRGGGPALRPRGLAADPLEPGAARRRQLDLDPGRAPFRARRLVAQRFDARDDHPLPRLRRRRAVAAARARDPVRRLRRLAAQIHLGRPGRRPGRLVAPEAGRHADRARPALRPSAAGARGDARRKRGLQPAGRALPGPAPLRQGTTASPST